MYQKDSDYQEQEKGARLWDGRYVQRDLLPGAVRDGREVHVNVMRVEANSGRINSRDVARTIESDGAKTSLAHVKEAETIK